MSNFIRSVVALASGALLAVPALAQQPIAIATASPFVPIANEPAPRLVVAPPLPEALARGAVLIPYQAENVRIAPIVGTSALGVSPRFGHLHVTVDDLPWHWADASGDNTIVVVGLAPGNHSVRLELADPQHRIYPGDTSATVRFIVPAGSPTPSDR
jgi:hypothetical protein